VLGRQPVVDGDRAHPGLAREVRSEADRTGRRAKGKTATVYVKDHALWQCLGDLDEYHRHTAELTRGELHVVRQRLPSEHLLEQWALDGNGTAQVKWGVAQHLIDRFALVPTHDWLLGFEVSVRDSMFTTDALPSTSSYCLV